MTISSKPTSMDSSARHALAVKHPTHGKPFSSHWIHPGRFSCTVRDSHARPSLCCIGSPYSYKKQQHDQCTVLWITSRLVSLQLLSKKIDNKLMSQTNSVFPVNLSSEMGSWCWILRLQSWRTWEDSCALKMTSSSCWMSSCQSNLDLIGSKIFPHQ